jgi:hypothetical protein
MPAMGTYIGYAYPVRIRPIVTKVIRVENFELLKSIRKVPYVVNIPNKVGGNPCQIKFVSGEKKANPLLKIKARTTVFRDADTFLF